VPSAAESTNPGSALALAPVGDTIERALNYSSCRGPAMRTCLAVFVGIIATVASSVPANGQPPKGAPRDTSRGDKLIDEYFRDQAKQIADRGITDVTSREDWEKRRPELRR